MVIGIIILTTGLYVVKGSTVLSPSPAIAADGEAFTLTCTYTGSGALSGFLWQLNGNTTGIILVAGCAPFKTPPDSSLYSYACPNNTSSTFTIKQISNGNNGNKWQCAAVLLELNYSDFVTITVQVSVNAVTLTSPTEALIENRQISFTCETSESRPAANVSWYKTSSTGQRQEITSSISWSPETVGDLEKSTSVLKYTPSRTDSGSVVYCTAINIPGRTPKISANYTFDVQYSPDGPPEIVGFADGRIYKVIENNEGSLSCTIKGGHPSATLTWNCSSSGTAAATAGTTVSKTVTWSASRGPDRSCTCQSSHPVAGIQSVSVKVQVLYKPNHPVFKVNGATVSGPIKFIEGKSRSVVCVSDGKPDPDSYVWTANGKTVRNEKKLSFNSIQRQNDSEYTCKAENTMIPSSGGKQIGSNSSTVKITVLFAPSTPSLYYGTETRSQIIGNPIDVVRGDSFIIVCASEGQPKPSCRWNGQTISSSILEITSINNNQTRICTAENSMEETNGDAQQGSSNSTLTLNMLYPPSINDCKLTYSTGSPTVVTHSIDVIEDSSFTVTCTANSKPAATFSWSGPVTSQSATLAVNKVTKQQNGTYTVIAENTMQRSFGKTAMGTDTRNISFDILYAPIVGGMNKEDREVGSELNVSCPVVRGNPSTVVFNWTRSGDNTVWNQQILNIKSVQKNDDMTYTCTVRNIMKPTGALLEHGENSGSFHLNVLYEASIKSFIEVNNHSAETVTVPENSSVRLQCNVESNPGSRVSILKDGESKISKNNTRQIIFTNSEVACNSAGIYSCVAYNDYNSDRPTKDFELFVTCSPRLLWTDGFKSNITSALHRMTMMKITVVAYPFPQESDFVWSKRNGSTWKTLTNDDNIKINTSGLDSSLIFLNVQVSDYQQYRVNVTNSIGQFHQEFFLNPQDKPRPPENVKVLDGSLRETSAIITWTPGFDGGLTQTFVVQYKKQGESDWIVYMKEDEATASMNISLTGLAHGTTYIIQMYSKNSEGNSSVTDTITFMTIAKTTEPSSDTALIGGAVGGSVFFIIVIVGIVVFFVRRSSFKKGKSKASSKRNDRTPVYEEEDDYGMQDNPMYVSAGPRQSNNKATENASRGGAVYSTVNKATKAVDSASDNEYAVVNKTTKTKAKQGKKEKENSKQGKKGKKIAQEGDIYENAPTKDLKAVIAKDETIYENPESSLPTQKKNTNKDGLIYADLTFNDQPKGQKKLVIHGLDSMTEYVEVDFTKKADPLPDSDDENIPPKN